MKDLSSVINLISGGSVFIDNRLLQRMLIFSILLWHFTLPVHYSPNDSSSLWSFLERGSGARLFAHLKTNFRKHEWMNSRYIYIFFIKIWQWCHQKGFSSIIFLIYEWWRWWLSLYCHTMWKTRKYQNDSVELAVKISIISCQPSFWHCA